MRDVKLEGGRDRIGFCYGMQMSLICQRKFQDCGQYIMTKATDVG
jgi:hypothetical protein